MKQVVQNLRSGDLSVWDVPAPMLRRGGLLVQVVNSLISAGTEKMIVDLGRQNIVGKAMARPDLVKQVIDKARREGVASTIQKTFTKLDSPVALGYSVSGRVIEVAEGVESFKVGDRVACAGAGYAAHAEIVSVPKNLVALVPGGVSDEDASFVTLGAIALQGVRQAQLTLGERVVVLGLGLIGQLTVQLVKAAGCRVLGFDPDPAKRELAKLLGADALAEGDLDTAVSVFTGGEGADAVIVTASTKSNGPVNDAARISRMKGRVVIVGLVGMALDRDPFYRKEIDLRMSMSYGPGRYDPAYEEGGQDYPLPFVRWTEQRNMSAFLELIAEGKVTPSKLVTHRYDIADAAKAYDLFESDEAYLGVALAYEPVAEARARTVRLAEERKTAPARGRIGFIGAGGFAKAVLLPAVKKIGDVELTIVVTSTGISARHTAQKFGFQSASTDPQALLSDPDTDTVFITSRHNTHAGYCASSLRNGKNVFCEKPLAVDEAGLQEVIAARESSQGLLALGFNRRFSPLIIEAKQALGAASPCVILYRVNAGAVPKDSWIHGEEGGGRIIGEVCHFIDTMMALCDSRPERIQAVAARGHDDVLTVQLSFADGSIGTLVYSSLGEKSFSKEYLEVFASGRVVVIDDFRKLTIIANGKRRTKAWPNQAKGHHELVGAFLAAVRSGGGEIQSFEDNVAVTRATFDIQAAIRS